MAVAAAEVDIQRCMATFVSILFREVSPKVEESETDGHLLSYDAFYHSQEDTITLMDEYLIMQADEEGNFPFQEQLSTGLAAALFGELVLRDLVALRRKKGDMFEPGSCYALELTQASLIPTNSLLLNEALMLMHKRPEEGAVWWMRMLTNYHLHKGIKHLASRCCEHAAQYGLLEKEEHKFLHLFHTKKYHTPESGYGLALKAELRDTVRNFALHGVRPPNLRRFALVALIFSLMRSRNVVKSVKSSHFFTKEEKKQALHNMDNIFLYRNHEEQYFKYTHNTY